MSKYVFITGGVVSSLGKGIVASSLGRLLRERNYKVSIQKLDPYLNVDPGTMSPYQHGEVFVTEDGAETDLDLGHYERFIDSNLKKSNSVTAGRIYSDVISKERKGEYLGGTVQMVPHVTNEIKDKIRKAAIESKAEILIIEVGGTVGDIESSIFLEAIRQFRKDVGNENVAYVHVTLVPNIKAANELKTKPTQHSVELLRSKGIQPNVLVLRSDKLIPKTLREKLSLFTDVALENIIESRDCKSIYEVPLELEKEGLATRVLDALHLENRVPDLDSWRVIVDKLKNPNKGTLNIGVVGKYVKLGDAYISVVESLKHACAEKGFDANFKMILSDDITSYEDAARQLNDVDMVCIPGGFGDRGIEGKLLAIRYARESLKPILGLCLGLQCMVIEFARNAVGLANANSVEFAPQSPYPVIHLMEEQTHIENKGGTMRLGRYPCKLKPGSIAEAAYKNSSTWWEDAENFLDAEDKHNAVIGDFATSSIVYERHRHRYEVNNFYRDRLSEKGLIFSGTSPDEKLVEIIELDRSIHPCFIASQFHPEFKSRPGKAHPLFAELVNATVKIKTGASKLDLSKQ